MAQTLQTRESDWITPMMAAGADGKVAALVATVSTAAFCDLSTLPGLPSDYSADLSRRFPSVLGHYITVQNSGTSDLGILFGPSKASVTGGNAPSISATTSVDATSGAVTIAVGCCVVVPAGLTKDFMLPLGQMPTNGNALGTLSPARFMGYISVSSTTMRVWMSTIPQN